MRKALIHVTLKPSVLDPQGKVVMQTLHALGYSSLSDARVSKYMELTFDSDDEASIHKQVEAICDKVLANPNTETYRYEIVPV
jgi:phosphoribosylformylglycinamidine synthase subunit PurS